MTFSNDIILHFLVNARAKGKNQILDLYGKRGSNTPAMDPNMNSKNALHAERIERLSIILLPIHALLSYPFIFCIMESSCICLEISFRIFF